MAKPPRIRRAWIALNVGLQIALVAGLLLGVNYLSFSHFARSNLSRNNKYALSGLTRRLLSSLKKETKIYVFFSQTATKSAGSELFNDVENLLKEYQFAGKHRVRVETINPYRDIGRATELQEKYKFEDKDNLIIIDYGDRSKLIRAVDLADYDTPGLFNKGQPTEVAAFKGEQMLRTRGIIGWK